MLLSRIHDRNNNNTFTYHKVRATTTIHLSFYPPLTQQELITCGNSCSRSGKNEQGVITKPFLGHRHTLSTATIDHTPTQPRCKEESLSWSTQEVYIPRWHCLATCCVERLSRSLAVEKHGAIDGLLSGWR